MNNLINDFMIKLNEVVSDLDSNYYTEISGRISYKRIKSDATEMFSILSEAYEFFAEKKNMDSFVTFYGCFVCFYLKTGMQCVFPGKKRLDKNIERFGEEIYKLNCDEKFSEYLWVLFNAILFNDKAKFIESKNIYPEYHLPNVFLFTTIAKEALTSVDDEVNKEMAEYYNSLSLELQSYVVGKSLFVQKTHNPIIDNSPLPYISFQSENESIIRGMLVCFKDCLSHMENELSDSEFKKLEMAKGRLFFQMLLKYANEMIRVSNSGEISDFCFSLDTVFEKLTYLCNESIEDTEGEDTKPYILKFHDLLALRLIGLGIPTVIHTNEDAFMSRLRIVTLNNSLEKTNFMLEEAIKQKEALINKHAHNWKHIAYPQTVNEVAKALYIRGDVEFANRLFHAYNSQSLLQSDLALLQLQYSTTAEDYKVKFRASVDRPGDERGIGIVEIFKHALQLVLFRLIMENVDTRPITGVMRDTLFSDSNRANLRESYVKSFILSEKIECDVLEWFSGELYPITLTGTTYCETINLRKDGIAYVQMTEIFIDLIHNAINYGVKSKGGFINFDIGMDSYEGKNFFVFKLTNPVELETSFVESEGQGLKSVNEVINKLNDSGGAFLESQVLSTEIKDGIFEIYFKIPEEVISRKRRA